MRKPGREEWVQLVAEYESGDLSQKEFAAKHEVSLSTLQFHLYKTRRLAKSPNSESGPAFLPVEVVASAAPKARVGEDAFLELAFRAGPVLRFPAGLDTRYLAELVAALG